MVKDTGFLLFPAVPCCLPHTCPDLQLLRAEVVSASNSILRARSMLSKELVRMPRLSVDVHETDCPALPLPHGLAS